MNNFTITHRKRQHLVRTECSVHEQASSCLSHVQPSTSEYFSTLIKDFVEKTSSSTAVGTEKYYRYEPVCTPDVCKCSPLWDIVNMGS